MNHDNELLVWHAGQWRPLRDQLKCSRCPRAMHAKLASNTDGTTSITLWCEHCDRGNP